MKQIIENLNELLRMVNKSKYPKMDNSHQLDMRKVEKLILETKLIAQKSISIPSEDDLNKAIRSEKEN